MYERVQKNRSSWSPNFKADYTESLFRPRPFSIQAQPDTESSEEQEIPAYSRAERDSISAKLLKTMGANVQSQTEAEAPKPHSESEGLESAEISDEAETLQRRGEKDEMSISLTTPVTENTLQLQAIALAPAAAAPAAVFGPVGLAVVIGVTGVTIIIWLNNGGWEEIGRITDVIDKGIENTLQELRNILNRAGDAAKAQLRRIEDYIGHIFPSIKTPQLLGNTRQVAIHLARLLRLSEVGGMPPEEDPDPGNDNDKHWWKEIKTFLKNIQQAIKGASRRQVMRELGKEFTEEQILEIERRLIEAAKKMGEDPPPFLPPS
jgi:hypothetical protein